MICKIEKVPRGIRGEKSSKDMASSRDKYDITAMVDDVLSRKKIYSIFTNIS